MNLFWARCSASSSCNLFLCCGGAQGNSQVHRWAGRVTKHGGSGVGTDRSSIVDAVDDIDQQVVGTPLHQGASRLQQ